MDTSAQYVISFVVLGVGLVIAFVLPPILHKLGHVGVQEDARSLRAAGLILALIGILLPAIIQFYTGTRPS